MWASVVFFLLAGVPAGIDAEESAYQDDEADDGGDTDFYDSYEADIAKGPAISTTLDTLTRVRRFEMHENVPVTGRPEEIRDVQDALKRVFYGDKNLQTLGENVIDSYTDIYDYVETGSPMNTSEGMESFPYPGVAIVPRMTSPVQAVQFLGTTFKSQLWSPDDNSQKTVTFQHLVSPAYEEETTEAETSTAASKTPSTMNEKARWWERIAVTEETPGPVKHWSPSDKSLHSLVMATVDENTQSVSSKRVVGPGKRVTWLPADEIVRATIDTNTETVSKKEEYAMNKRITWLPAEGKAVLLVNKKQKGNEGERKERTRQAYKFRQGVTTTTTKMMATDENATPLDENSTEVTMTTLLPTTFILTTRTTTTREPTAPTYSGMKMDINSLINIIANLTYDYDWNLTEQFNRSLYKQGVPMCKTEGTFIPTTVTEYAPTTHAAYDFSNSSVVSKCFVCGLHDFEIPRNAFCHDAFAGDFLPLMPVNPRARSYITTFRKYCRYLDVHNFVENPLEPRSIYGRFTGGCGVRWTDLSGVYTQRTCRNRYRPVMGKHYASKRMAKLELALLNVENGCIISPMASLLPLSRGISLYARFHACVCTGNWCNRAADVRQWSAYISILTYWLTKRI